MDDLLNTKPYKHTFNHDVYRLTFGSKEQMIGASFGLAFI